MKIQNIRFGHACNSSSLHSIIVFDKGHKPEFCNDDCEADGEYYENDFTLASEGAKLGYIGALLEEAMSARKLPPYLLDYYRDTWLKGRDGHDVQYKKDTYVDGKAIVPLPGYYNSTHINKEFFDEMKAAILDPDAVIVGGDDQCNTPRVMEELIPGVPNYDRAMVSRELKKNHARLLPMDSLKHYPAFESARKDPKYGFWSVFERKTGTKVRLSFDDTPILCASRPELVDVKITDKCSRLCPYCYQNSTPDGKSAKIDDLRRIVDALAELEVWEIAWNGGEPTEYPKFWELLMFTYQTGIVSNFTTRNVDWFKVKSNRDVVKKYCGRVAFSVGGLTKDDFEFLESLSDEINLCYQAIDQIDVISDELLVKCDELTLLGFKEQGRAKGLDRSLGLYAPHRPFDEIIEHVAFGNRYQICPRLYVRDLQGLYR